MSLLENIGQPSDMRRLGKRELKLLAAEIRSELLSTVMQTGGHLASNLGVVELTIALHSTFDSPRDKIIWDVGHQAYVHKLLTGRREQFLTIRQMGGICGFPDPRESEHDAFGTGHASTSVSAALGIAVARDLVGEKNHVVAVIGDGAMGGGLAFEGANNAGHLGTRLIVVLNDNGMSIAPNVGALAKNINAVRSDPRYTQAKAGFERLLVRLPLGGRAANLIKRAKLGIKGLVIPTLIWEELGFTYLGPVDGHDISALRDALEHAKRLQKPVVVHVCTVKGKGYVPAEDDAVKFHGVAPNGSKATSIPTYSAIFGRTMLRIASCEPRLVAITAAMADGTGLAAFAKEYPQRFFDVGIAEGHAVTFAAGLASQGLRPVVAVYSTFLQRAYDQIVHDVCLQGLPVVLAIDRAGVVGDDGETHQGAFDISFLRHVPGMVLMSPKDENELQHMLWTAVHTECPTAVRYPRGTGVGVALDTELMQLPLGKAELLRRGSDVAIVAYGPLVQTALAAAEALAESGVNATVVNARFVKPLDETLIRQLADEHDLLLTVEENSIVGGLGSAVLEALEPARPFKAVVRSIGLPDQFVEHGSPDKLRAKYGLNVSAIVAAVDHAMPSGHRDVHSRVRKVLAGL